MANTTENLGLILPERTDNFNIDDFNNNFKAIDEKSLEIPTKTSQLENDGQDGSNLYFNTLTSKNYSTSTPPSYLVGFVRKDANNESNIIVGGYPFAEFIDNKADIEIGTVGTNYAWYDDSKSRSMTGDYTLVGDMCFLRATCPLISGWGNVYYSLPVAAVSSASTLALVGSTIHSINTDTLSSNGTNFSVLQIKTATGSVLSSGAVYFTLCYKYK